MNFPQKAIHSDKDLGNEIIVINIYGSYEDDGIDQWWYTWC